MSRISLVTDRELQPNDLVLKDNWQEQLQRKSISAKLAGNKAIHIAWSP